MNSVCHVAEVLTSLQAIGNVYYTGWRLHVPCSRDSATIGILQNQAKRMECELYEWQNKVKLRREEFYELNYFNTMQLLSLRKELGSVKVSEGLHTVCPAVLALLQSISPQITPKIVSETVCQVISRTTTQDILEPLPLPMPVASSHSIESAPTPKCEQKKCSKTLSEAYLTNHQKEMMYNISSRLECSFDLVLKSFEYLKAGCEQSEYEHWCLNNLDLDDSEDDSSNMDSDEVTPDASVLGRFHFHTLMTIWFAYNHNKSMFIYYCLPNTDRQR